MATGKKQIAVGIQQFLALAQWVDSTPDDVAASTMLSSAQVASLFRCSVTSLERARKRRDELLATMKQPDPSALEGLEYSRLSSGSQKIGYPMLAVKKFLK